MVAFVKSLPDNPVPVITPSVVQTADTTISWDSGNSTVLTRLMMSKDAGVTFKRFGAAEGAPATRLGKGPLKVTLGVQYDFELHDAATGAVLARTVVGTREVNALLNPLVGAIHVKVPAKQAIYQLQVFPGVESVRVVFRTRQPTTPFLDVRHADNDAVAGAMFGVAGTVHDYEVALAGDPTPQGQFFNLRILAPSTAGVVQPAQATVKFVTGTRRVQVFFDHLFVRKDGDPGPFLGDGDFVIQMGAGDTADGRLLAETGFQDSVGDDEDRTMDRVIILDACPPEIWTQAYCFEDDYSGTNFHSLELEFEPEGVRQFIKDSAQVIQVTIWFDMNAFPDVTRFPIKFETGPRLFDLTITGQLDIETHRGAVVSPDISRPGRAYRTPDPVTYLGAGEEARTAGDTSLQRSDRGELYRVTPAARTGRSLWSQAAPATPGVITAVATKGGHRVFSLGEDGEARSLDAQGAWTPIGGRFVGRLLAVDGKDGPTLIGLDRAGVAHQSRGDGAWREVAGGVAADLQAIAPNGAGDGGGAALVARDGKGEVLYLASTAAGGDWTRLGAAPPGKLAAARTGEGLAFAVLGEDETLTVALTGDPPGRLDWRPAGDLTGLLDRRYSLADFAAYEARAAATVN